MIYICIPAYNEERTAGVLLWKIRQVMAEFQRDYQFLVVDDASTDATASILEPYTRVLPLTVLTHEERRGYAASLEEMLRIAVKRSDYPRRDVIVTLQADFTEEPDEIPTMVKRIEGGADVVTSTAVFDRTQAPRAVRWARRTLGFLARRPEESEQVKDPLSGFRAYRLVCVKKALDSRKGAPLLEWEGWAANAALLEAVRPFCRRLEEATVALRYDRRRRATRFEPWSTFRQLVRYSRQNGNGQPTAAAVTDAEPRRAGEPGESGDGDGGAPAASGARRRPRGSRRGGRGRPRGGRRGGGRRGGREPDGGGERTGSANTNDG